jgi:diaminopimelate epimerase
MKIIKFIKMQSLGNDFVIIDQLKNPYKLSKNQIKKICDRNYGIGCDQAFNY